MSEFRRSKGDLLNKVPALLLAAILLSDSRAMASDRTDVAVWVYGAQAWSDSEAIRHLARRPARAGRLYLSVETGSRLLVDDPADAARIGAALDAAACLGLQVEAMLLQDPGWLKDSEGAAVRAARVIAFDRARRAAGRPGFIGLHFDIEPHTEEEWVCGDATARRDMLRRLHDVFGRIARARDEAGAPRLMLSAALPWWLGSLSAEMPEAAPSALLTRLDEMVLMVYGDPGGPLVGESAAAVLRRVDDPRIWSRIPPGRGLRVGLATYEYRDEAALEVAIREVSVHLGGRAGFRGVAVFELDQPFSAPLVASIAGQVLDRVGTPIPGARIQVANRTTSTNRCGLFGLAGVPFPAAFLTVVAPGFAPAEVSLAGLVPGRERTLPPITLEVPP